MSAVCRVGPDERFEGLNIAYPSELVQICYDNIEANAIFRAGNKTLHSIWHISKYERFKAEFFISTDRGKTIELAALDKFMSFVACNCPDDFQLMLFHPEMLEGKFIE